MNVTDNKEIINALAVKHRIDASLVKEVIEHSLKCVKECMEMPEMPNILLEGLGRYKPCKRTIDRKFTNLTLFLRKDPENINKVDWERIKILLSTYERIAKEEKKPLGKSATAIKELVNNLNLESNE
jgi:nucleoid DNA-binding protein